MLRVVEPPEITKEMLDDMKLHLRVDHDEEDGLIKTLMKATREYAEGTLCGRAFEIQTLELTVDDLPKYVTLPKPPLINVESVTCLLEDGDEVILDDDLYDVHFVEEPGSVIMKTMFLVPVKQTLVTYKTGYQDPPSEYLLWQKLMVAHYYENRQAILPMGHNIMKTPFVADYLLQSYRMFGVT